VDHAVGIIPARYGSTRFPGKPLAPILGKPMIRWVYEGARRSKRLSRIVIATDDARIFDAAREFGAEAMMTSPDHASGTDRVAEVAARLDASVIVNIQGDEPLLDGTLLDGLVAAFDDPGLPMASLMARVSDVNLIGDENIVKVVVDNQGDALMFSRSPLPRGASDFFFQHIGIYAYRKDFLLALRALPASRLEKIERLEQLRVLENGLRIRMIEIPRPTLSVDTPRDIIPVEEFLKARSHE
jgi:3-deoxy-manno-octulosonate cytidylyltransferase (CMP-KDO synthetase)